MLVRTATVVAVAGLVAASSAHAQSAGGNDAEIALLKQQLRLMEQKLDKLQKQTTANTQAAATATAKADTAKAEVKTAVANANASYPVKGAPPISGRSGSFMNSAATIWPPAARVAAIIRRAESGFHTPLLSRVPGLIAKDVTIGALMALEKSTTLRHRCAVRTP